MIKKPLALALILAALPAAAMAQNCGDLTLDVCPTPYDQTLPAAKDMLTWDQASRVVGFRNDYRNYAGDVFRHGAAVPLERAEKPLTHASYTLNGHTWTLQDYLKRENVSGMLVLKDGKVAWKYLGNGNTDTTLWTSRSVGKSVVSTLVGIAIQQGKIHSLDDLITVYEPELKGTAWDGVTLRQLIQHTSGVDWNEDYTNPQSHFARLTQCEAQPGAYDCVRKIVSTLSRKHPAGEQWSYSSGGAWLLAMCWNARPVCRWPPGLNNHCGSLRVWPTMASGMLISKGSMMLAPTALTPPSKTGAALASLSPAMVG